MKAVCLFCLEDLTPSHFCFKARLFLRLLVAQMMTDTRTTHPNRQTASIQTQKDLP